MALDLLEKLIISATILLVLLVSAAVGAASYLPPRTGHDVNIVDGEIAFLAWREQYSQPNTNPSSKNNSPNLPKNNSKPTTNKRSRIVRVSAPKQYSSNRSPQQVTYSKDYFQDGQHFPKNQAVQSIPWLRYEPGVSYHYPKLIPASLVERFQAVDAAVSLMKEPRGFFKETPNGNSFTIQALPKKSYLSSVVGLQKGDRLISVNGHLIRGVGISAAKEIYNEVKNAKHFAVKVERNGKLQVLTFTVKR